MADLARGLAHAGVEVELLTTELTAAYREELAAAGLRAHEIAGVDSKRYSTSYLRRVAREINRLSRLSGQAGYDIIHGHEFALGFWRRPENLSAKVVVTVHGTITSETPLHPDVFAQLGPLGKAKALARYGRRWLFAPAWGRMLAEADRIVVDSRFTRGELERRRPSLAPKITRVPLGLDMSRFPKLARAEARKELEWSAPQGESSLVTVGRLEWQKGHDIALEALASLKDLPWRYTIVGEGNARPGLERLIARLGLADRVRLAGRVTDERKTLMLAAADLFLWPERTHPAFGLVGLEALIMGTPVLATQRGAIGELIDERSGWLCPGHEPADFARVLRPLLADPSAIAERAGGLTERTLEAHSPQSMIRSTLDVYRELSARRT